MHINECRDVENQKQQAQIREVQSCLQRRNTTIAHHGVDSG